MNDHAAALTYAHSIVAKCRAGRTMPLELVQLAEMAIEQHQDAKRYCGALIAVRATLERENGKSITDTIWHTDHETLFDYIDGALGAQMESVDRTDGEAMTEEEWRGVLEGRCMMGDMFVGESLPAYLARCARLLAQEGK